MFLCIINAAWALQKSGSETPVAEPKVEVEQSLHGDPLATARTALGTLGSRIEKLEARIAQLEARKAPSVNVKKLKEELQQLIDNAIADAPDPGAAERALAEIRAARDSANNSRAEAVKAAERAEAAARRAEQSAASRPPVIMTIAPTGNLNPPEPVSKDDEDHTLRPYGAIGLGASWMFRDPSYGTPNEFGVAFQETSELSSGMLDVDVEAGVRDFGPGGRFNAFGRGTAAYNVGGGYAFDGALGFGTFVEKTHVVKLGLFGGVGWETIPKDSYEERRWLAGVEVEFVMSEHVGLLLFGEILPDNAVSLSGSNAGRTGLHVRARF